MRKRLVVLAIAITFILGSMATGYGSAVTATMSANKRTCTVGDTISVTLTYKNGTFGAVQGTFSFSSKLQLIGDGPTNGTYNPGNGTLILDSAGSTSMSTTFKFKAVAAGDASVYMSNVTGGTIDKTPFDNGASVSITIKEKSSGSSSSSGGSSSSGSSSSGSHSGSSGSSSSSGGSSGSSGAVQSSPSGTNGRGDFDEATSTVVEPPEADDEEKTEEEEEPDPSEKPDNIEVEVGDRTYVIVDDLKDKKLPEGFEAKDSAYGEYDWNIQIAVSDESEYKLILLSDPETDEEKWFFYDEETEKITSSRTISVEEALEYERLAIEAEKGENSSMTIILGAAALAFALAFAGLGGYTIYNKRKKENEPGSDLY